MTKTTCSVEECASKVVARGWCDKHYRRWRKHGDPLAVTEMHTSSPEESFALRTEWHGDCLIWTGANTPAGYGIIIVGGKNVYVYRWVWEREHGPIPEGMQVDHFKCFNPACCEIRHLRLTTHKQNQENRKGAQRNGTSGHRGVHWDKARSKWVVVVKHHSRVIHGGRFAELDDAVEAARELRNSLFTHNTMDRISGR